MAWCTGVLGLCAQYGGRIEEGASTGALFASARLTSTARGRAARALDALRQGFENLDSLRGRGLEGWTTAGGHCQGWTGVACNDVGRVTALCALPPHLWCCCLPSRVAPARIARATGQSWRVPGGKRAGARAQGAGRLGHQRAPAAGPGRPERSAAPVRPPCPRRPPFVTLRCLSIILWKWSREMMTLSVCEPHVAAGEGRRADRHACAAAGI